MIPLHLFTVSLPNELEMLLLDSRDGVKQGLHPIRRTFSMYSTHIDTKYLQYFTIERF